MTNIATYFKCERLRVRLRDKKSSNFLVYKRGKKKKEYSEFQELCMLIKGTMQDKFFPPFFFLSLSQEKANL